MGVREVLLRALGGIPKETYLSRLREAYQQGWWDGNDDPATADFAQGGQGYRRAGAAGDSRLVSWDENLRIAENLVQRNPLASRAAEIARDYIIGGGVHPETDDPALQDILDDFWRRNEMGRLASELVHQWLVYGVQVLPVFVRRTDGRVTLGYIAPQAVDRVIAHPDNPLRMVAVVVKPQPSTDPWAPPVERAVYRIVQTYEPRPHVLTEPASDEERKEGRWVTAEQADIEPWETEMLNAMGVGGYAGSCFLWRKNHDSDQGLGRSDFLPVADLLDKLDSVTFSLVQREELANLIFAEVIVDGTPEEVRARMEELMRNPPGPGSLNVHTAGETWNLNAPTLNQTASVALAESIQGVIAGGLGFPVSWFGRGDETNRATAQAQGDPTWKTLQHDQGLIRAYLIQLLEFVRDQAVIAGYYRPAPDTDTSIALPMPSMVARDLVSTVSALSTAVSAAQIAVETRLMTRQAAITLVQKVLGELSIEMDAEELLDADADERQAALLLSSWKAVHPPVVGGD